MLKKYKNHFHKIIIDSGFDPSKFKGEETFIDKFPAFVIKYDGTSFEFVALNLIEDPHSFNWQCTSFSTGSPLTEDFDEGTWYGAEDIFHAFKSWLTEDLLEYIYELETPDMWDQLEKNKFIIGGFSVEFEDNILFSNEEKKHMLESLAIFKENVQKELRLSEKEALFLNERIDYLAGAVDRLTKFDWKNVAISTLITVSVALSLDVEKGRLLFNLFKEAFKFTLKLISS